MKNQIAEAIQLRKDDKPEEALLLFKKILIDSPNDPQVNYQLAWTCDSMGKESDAVPYYEKAIENGLSGEDLRGALLGLGSTYRCLGEYHKSLSTFDQGVAEFPKDRSLKAFRALTYYNLGKHQDSVRELMNQLLETTSDENIKSYEKALRFYSDKLEETWR